MCLKKRLKKSSRVIASSLTIIIVATLIFLSCKIDSEMTPLIQVGLDRVPEHRSLFSNKRVGIITNHTAYNSKNEHIIDVFLKMEDARITAIFGPEHGIRGDEEAGRQIDEETDPIRNIPIYSLYGQTQKPTPEMLRDVDLLIFDIQDIGARFYTYIYTMSLAMEAAAEQGKTFVVLDRPNPINGVQVEGTILKFEFATFVGLYPMAIRHGMTVGELALMINGEGWLSNGVVADLKVIPLKGWKRSLWYDETGLKWRKTSPNMPSLAVATVYPGSCLIEGTNVSEGRGTYEPFLQIGAPWIESQQLISQLQQFNLSGIQFQAARFTLQSISGMAQQPKFEGMECHGIKLVVTDRNQLRPFIMGIALVKSIYDLYTDKFVWNIQHFDRLCGTDEIRKMIINHAPLDSIERSWQNELAEFLKIRERYLLYQ